MNMAEIRHLLVSLGVAAACGLAVNIAIAQTYPSKPIRMVVGFAAGGGADTTARLIAQKLPDVLGQQVLVENRTGASGAIANERVATAPPDGYTALLMTASDTITPALRKLPYDMERDFAPVAQVALATFVLVVHPSVPASDVKQLVALAKKQPGRLSYGSAGIGGAPHLAGALFGSMAGIDIKHVPYKGGAESVIATASGQIELNFVTIPSLLPFIPGGRLKPLAVSGVKRASFLPDLPTVSEAGLPGYDRTSWYGILLPVGVPQQIVAQLHGGITRVVALAEMKEAFAKQGLEPQQTAPEQFAAILKRELAENARIIRSSGAKTE